MKLLRELRNYVHCELWWASCPLVGNSPAGQQLALSSHAVVRWRSSSDTGMFKLFPGIVVKNYNFRKYLEILFKIFQNIKCITAQGQLSKST